MSKEANRAVLTMTESTQGEYLIRVTQGGSVIFGDVILRLPTGLSTSLQTELASSLANAVLRHISNADKTAMEEVQQLFYDWGCFDVIDEDCL
ncbi:hypothetical protein [Endozoicomonas lisbonensis]|uniref:Divalent metal cation (Fe/Co/Zn/Cd) transporter n=1 Tax=Endozoicomonas lisbonensis TaxID=3120522 RepID=A0ABV2SMZ0_9GAMM